MTPAETLLWDHLRNRRLSGLKFRRQHPLGPFVVDFYCAEHRLAVEIDGEIHREQVGRDTARTKQLQDHNYRVIRFSNDQVLSDPKSVLDRISAACLQAAASTDQ